MDCRGVTVLQRAIVNCTGSRLFGIIDKGQMAPESVFFTKMSSKFYKSYLKGIIK